MKNYTITVNGTAYDVVVEEKDASDVNVAAAPAAAKPAAPKAAPAPAKAAPKAKPASSGGGSVKITAPMPGKILSVKADEGAQIKKGDVILLLEAMKMENEVVAPQDGVVASINVASGDMVESGDVLATMD
ncbi:MAG: biotin/lipoyl-binding protein [Eubacterium sp.]|nr:biotin/lipoyl-binding protein [Eubacterium sp.]